MCTFPSDGGFSLNLVCSDPTDWTYIWGRTALATFLVCDFQFGFIQGEPDPCSVMQTKVEVMENCTLLIQLRGWSACRQKSLCNTKNTFLLCCSFIISICSMLHRLGNCLKSVKICYSFTIQYIWCINVLFKLSLLGLPISKSTFRYAGVFINIPKWNQHYVGKATEI